MLSRILVSLSIVAAIALSTLCLATAPQEQASLDPDSNQASVPNPGE